MTAPARRGATAHAETPMTDPTRTPHWDDLTAWEVAVLGYAREIASPDNPRQQATFYTGDATSQIVMSSTVELRSRLDAEYQRGLREGRLDNSVVRAEVVGSAEWLRDLADRLQQCIADWCALPDGIAADTTTFSPSLIRKYADDEERDDRQAAADTRDRERVEEIARRNWTADRAKQPFPTLAPAWEDLSEAERAHSLDRHLEVYRAGRDDQEANRG